MIPAKLAPDLSSQKSGTLEERKHHHYIMFEDDMHFRPLHTYILDIYKVFEPLVCCLKRVWVHPCTVTPAKLAPDLGILGCLWGVKMVPLRQC
jgi:hypothetical protein